MAKAKKAKKKAALRREEIIEGYRQLAFGRANDALKLLFFDEMPPLDVLEDLDIFNVSDIKRPKGGGMELKFFDRFEALQRLEAMDGATENTAAAQAFYNAIGREDEG